MSGMKCDHIDPRNESVIVLSVKKTVDRANIKLFISLRIGSFAKMCIPSGNIFTVSLILLRLVSSICY